MSHYLIFFHIAKPLFAYSASLSIFVRIDYDATLLTSESLIVSIHTFSSTKGNRAETKTTHHFQSFFKAVSFPCRVAKQLGFLFIRERKCLNVQVRKFKIVNLFIEDNWPILTNSFLKINIFYGTIFNGPSA